MERGGNCLSSVYASFARWHRLSLMRAPKTMRDIEAVAKVAAHPERLRALLRLIRDELGYELYRTVSGVKAALSVADTEVLRFRHADFAIEETCGDGGPGVGRGGMAGGGSGVPDRRDVAGDGRSDQKPDIQPTAVSGRERNGG